MRRGDATVSKWQEMFDRLTGQVPGSGGGTGNGQGFGSGLTARPRRQPHDARAWAHGRRSRPPCSGRTAVRTDANGACARPPGDHVRPGRSAFSHGPTWASPRSRSTRPRSRRSSCAHGPGRKFTQATRASASWWKPHRSRRALSLRRRRRPRARRNGQPKTIGCRCPRTRWVGLARDTTRAREGLGRAT